jgi:hypothetical protein
MAFAASYFDVFSTKQPLPGSVTRSGPSAISNACAADAARPYIGRGCDDLEDWADFAGMAPDLLAEFV